MKIPIIINQRKLLLYQFLKEENPRRNCFLFQNRSPSMCKRSPLKSVLGYLVQEIQRLGGHKNRHAAYFLNIIERVVLELRARYLAGV